MYAHVFKLLVNLSVVSILLIFSTEIRAAEQQEDVQLTLPAHIYAVQGGEMSVYFANTILAEQPDAYRFEVMCDVGTVEGAHWKIAPTPGNVVGEYEFSLTVFGPKGKKLATATSSLIVVPGDAGQDERVRLLLVGDSLTHASRYPNRIATLLGQPGNPPFEMLGTHKPASVAENVAHEGYGGWTWQRFVEHYEPNPDGTHRKKSSPFVFLDTEGKPELNVQRYIDEHCEGQPPSVVVFKLGINDCFHVDPNNQEAVDNKIEAVFEYAERLVAAFREVAPRAVIGICLTTPGNARDAAFVANYKDRYTRWGWRRIQHRLVQRQIEQFAGREQEKIFLIPTQLNLDTQGGYPENNGVHPNTVGYDQIGTSIYAWLKYRLSELP